MAKTPGPLKWHGGKAYLADWIVSLMPPRCENPNDPSKTDLGWLHYVEPYFGGGAVMLAMNPEGISEVANDLHRELSNFWVVLQNDEAFSLLKRKLEAVPFSESEWNQANRRLRLRFDDIDVGLAAEFFIRCRQSLSGRMAGFASITRNRTRRGMNEQVSAWLNAIEGLPAVHARMKRVLILNKPALEIIQREDGPRTLYYLDPPYAHETRATTKEYGEFEMNTADHMALLKTLEKVEGRFILSGYHSDLYDKTAARMGWNCYKKNISNNAAGGKTKRVMVECCWTNYEAKT